MVMERRNLEEGNHWRKMRKELLSTNLDTFKLRRKQKAECKWASRKLQALCGLSVMGAAIILDNIIGALDVILEQLVLLPVLLELLSSWTVSLELGALCWIS